MLVILAENEVFDPALYKAKIFLAKNCIEFHKIFRQPYKTVKLTGMREPISGEEPIDGFRRNVMESAITTIHSS